MLKLDAINAMLAAIGEDPVTDADSNHPSAVKARTALELIDKRVQEIGWWFNKDYGLTLSPTIQGDVVVPDNTLSVDPSDEGSALVQRGKKLYDPVNHTYNIGTTVAVDLVIRIDFESLPEAAASYIAAYALWQFYVDDDGDEYKSQKYLEERERLRIELRRQHLKVLDLNVNNKPAVARLMGRIRPASSYTNSSNPILPGGG